MKKLILLVGIIFVLMFSMHINSNASAAYNYVYRYVCLLITNDIVFCAFAKHTNNEHKCLYRIVYYPSGNTLACCLYIAGYNWQ